MEPALHIALRLSKDWGYPPQQVLSTPTHIVLAQLEYATFTHDYESAYMNLNAPEKNN